VSKTLYHCSLSLASFRFCETQYLLLLHACSATVLCLLGGLMQVLLPKRRGRYADFDINLSIPNLSLFSLANPTVYSSLTPHGKATPKQLPSQVEKTFQVFVYTSPCIHAICGQHRTVNTAEKTINNLHSSAQILLGE